MSRKVRAIRRKVLRMILEASKDTDRPNDPKEFFAVLRAEEGVVTELLFVPTILGNVHAIPSLHMLPIDFTVAGTVHSHPSGVYRPSGADLNLFSHFGRLHIIVGRPYTEETWQAYDHNGNPVALEVLP